MTDHPHDPEKILSRSYDVFLSYDTENERETQAAERLASGLQERGYSVWWDRELLTGDWKEQLRRKALNATAIITLETARYHTREMCLFEMEIGLKQGTLKRFKIEPCDDAPALAADLAAVQYFELDHQDEGFIDRVIEKLDFLPADKTIERARSSPTVHLGELPQAPARLIGRETEMAMLRQAWSRAEKTVVVLHALGGAGKSAILSSFVNEVLDDQGSGASRIFGWSAYSQGSSQKKGAADAEGFIAEALTFFGVTPPEGADGVTRARLLAAQIAKQRALLLLDGIEPLQSPPNVNQGRLTNKALAALLKELQAQNQGLVVITSRQELPELPAAERIVNWKLDRLDKKGGAELLLDCGVIGRQRDLEAAVEELHGHALSVKLLGSYLNAVEAGDIARRDQFRLQDISVEAGEGEDETDALAKRTERVMQGYLEQLEHAPGGGAPERALLSILGLFDRPVDGPAVRALLAGPAIPGLTDVLFQLFALGPEGLTEQAVSGRQKGRRWRRAKERLRQLGLLAPRDEGDSDVLDAHPIVRNYFRKRVSETEPEGWRAAHDRLYAHYAAAPEKEQPDTLEEMQPLFHACAHGAQAGKAQEAFDEIYYARIRRRDADYMFTQLGAFDASLSVLAQFFADPWGAPLPELRPADQAVALSFAAFALRGLGRLEDAVEPMRAGTQLAAKHQDWTNAAAGAGNLSELLLTIGRVPDARAAAAEALGYAEQSEDLFWRMTAHSQAGDAAHQAGALEEAADLFVEAEKLQVERQPEFPRLYSMSGYWYCDLLLSRGAAGEALERAEWMVSINKTQPDILSRSLHTLALGRAKAALADPAPNTTPQPGLIARLLGARPETPYPERAQRLAEAATHLDAAVKSLRAAGSEDHLPRGLLARAAFLRGRFAEGDAAARAQAATDLTEAQEIAEHGGMGLYKADIALERARWALLDCETPTAASHLAQARSQIEKCGYGRRLPELEALEAEVKAGGGSNTPWSRKPSPRDEAG